MSSDHHDGEPAAADDVSLDLYARMVRRSLGVPVAIVTMVEERRQVFPGAIGLPAAYQASRETPLSHSFCQYVVGRQRPLVVTDAREVDFLADNLAIDDLGVIGYAGWPITDHRGVIVGSLCAIDTEPRDWTAAEIDALEDIASACSAELTERGRRAAATRALDEAERLGERSRALLALSEALMSIATLGDLAEAIDRVSREQLGALHADVWLLADEAHTTVGPRALVRVPDTAEGHRTVLVDTDPLGAALVSSRPVFLDDAARQDGSGADGGAARAFVPLLILGRSLGVLSLTWRDPRAFGEDDRVTLTALAAYTAQAAQRAVLLQERVDVSVTLQRAMLTELPQVSGIELAARYLPAHARDQVGGDWYDAMPLRSGATMLVVGDVVGHDIAAAAVMGQLRSMLRGVAYTHDESPSQSLLRLDGAAQDLRVGTFASVLLAHLGPAVPGRAGRRMLWSSAGHVPAVVLDASGVAREAQGSCPNDCLLGVDASLPRHDHETVLEPGSVLMLYTDGLVERRREPLDVGLARLRAALERHGSRPLDELLDGVIADLLGAAGDDDVAVLVARVE